VHLGLKGRQQRSESWKTGLLTLSLAFSRFLLGTARMTFSTAVSTKPSIFDSGRVWTLSSVSKTGTLLVAIFSALPEAVTRVFVTHTYSLETFGKVSSSSESRTAILCDPTPLRFLTLVACVRVESPLRFDMVEGEERGTRGLIGWEMHLCVSHVAEVYYCL